MLLMVGKNDLETWCKYNKSKHLLEEWDYKKNGDLTPQNISYQSNKKIHWKCDKGHEWESSVNNRQRGNGCPICSGRRVLRGYNDFETWCKQNQYDDLLKEWSTENDKKPSEVTCGSHYVVLWVCSLCGKEWSSPVKVRVKYPQKGCSSCSHKEASKKMNAEQISRKGSLVTIEPEIASEWCYEKNGELRPEDILPGSNMMAWWVCEKGHTYKASVNQRCYKKTGCPYCSGHKVLEGYNDLVSTFPELCKEWDNDNNSLKPNEVSSGSNKKIFWKCSHCGFSWEAAVCERTSGRGCPRCAVESKSSFPEQAVFYYIKKEYPDAINGDRKALNGKELDIFIPSKKMAIEYDGKNWHNRIDKDIEKNKACKEKGIKLIRIREKGNYDLLDDNVIVYTVRYEDYNQLGRVIEKIIKDISNCYINVDIEKDRSLIYSQYIKRKKENSIGGKYPELLRLWDYSKNGDLNPESVSVGSQKKVYWKCDKGHSYQQKIRDKVIGRGCPICENSQLLIGYNDFESWCKKNKREALLKEWDYERNTIKPHELFYGSEIEVWWKCPNGHSYKALMYNHVKGVGCPYCSNPAKKVLSGYNDFKTLFPIISNEWDYEKNKGLKPEEVLPGSAQKVWWKCEKGHTYYTSIYSRSNGTGCPICGLKVAEKRVCLIEKNEVFSSITDASRKLGINSSSITLCCQGKLKTAGGFHWEYVDYNPQLKENFKSWCINNKRNELLNEWDYDSNNGLKPEEFTKGSNKKIIWKCSKGHTWFASIKCRSRGTGCPCCNKESRKGRQ